MTKTIDPTREITHQRTLHAPRELVLRMWSNPEHLANWWGPVGFSTETYEMDFKEGGFWRFAMIGPDGTRYSNFIRYDHISEDRIEFKHCAGPNDPATFEVEVILEDKGDTTELYWRSIFPTAADRDHVVKVVGADKGLESTVGRLDQYVAQRDHKLIELSIVRQFKAPIQKVFDAWTAEGAMQKWAGPQGWTTTESEGDVRVGGAWSFRMISAEGEVQAARGEYTEVSPPNRLSFTYQWVGDDDRKRPVMDVFIHFVEVADMTTMTFVQTGFDNDEMSDGHVRGWSSSFEKLADYLGESK